MDRKQKITRQDAQTLYDRLRIRIQNVEDAIESYEELTPGDNTFEAIKTDILALNNDDPDITLAPDASTLKVIEHLRETLEAEHYSLTDELQDLEASIENSGLIVDTEQETSELQLALLEEVNASVNSAWKRKADEYIDAQKRLCPGENPETNKTQCLDEHPCEEVHVLVNDDDANDADTIKRFNDENDIMYDPQPLSVTLSGAIRNNWARVSPEVSKQLMPHQAQCVRFVLDLFRNGRNGCVLALSMGMGKTLTALVVMGVMAVKFPKAYILVLAPAVIAPNWEREYDKWAIPNLILHGVIQKMCLTTKRALKNAREMGGAVVTTLDTFRMHSREFGTPTLMVIDEGHRIKNNCSQLFATVDSIRPRYRLALTGTPLQNNLQECFTLINWVAPGLLGSVRQFQNCFRNDIEDIEVADCARSKGRVHILKRKLDEVVFRNDSDSAHILPPKHEYRIALKCPVPPISNETSVLTKYSKTLEHTMSIKIVAIREIVKAIVDLQKKTVIFSGRKKLLFEMARYFPGSVMTGETDMQERQDMIDSFQSDPNCQVIYISTKTGAQGINLTKGTEVIIADASFNPTWEMQAVCRCWRIGQTFDVNVYRLIGFNTFEDDVYHQQLSKFSLFARIVDGNEVDFSVDAERDIHLKKVDTIQDGSVLQHIAQNVDVEEITHHEFEQHETDLSFQNQQNAINAYNVISAHHPRSIRDENDTFVDVKPSEFFAGVNLVAPFAPVLANTTPISECIDLLPAKPAFHSFTIEQQRDTITTIFSTKMRDIYKIKLVETGIYRWRIKGMLEGSESPWSEWSAAVKVG